MNADELRGALVRLVAQVDDAIDNYERATPFLDDEGCIECTAGTVPDDRNRGLCAYHFAKDVLARNKP